MKVDFRLADRAFDASSVSRTSAITYSFSNLLSLTCSLVGSIITAVSVDSSSMAATLADTARALFLTGETDSVGDDSNDGLETAETTRRFFVFFALLFIGRVF